MALKITRNRNTNDTATISSPITLNQTTTVKIADANEDRIFFNVSVDCGVVTDCVFIKLQAASTDDDKKGIILATTAAASQNAFKLDWQMTPDNIYTGEISAITKNGAVVVVPTEY